MDRWIDGWIEGQTDGRMDGWIRHVSCPFLVSNGLTLERCLTI